MAAPAHPPELRPYRVAVYALFIVFVALFIGLVIRSVWVDLYGRGPSPGLLAGKPTAGACVDELESLFRRLQARSSLPLDPRAEDDWARFSREFEDRLNTIESRCVDGEGLEADPELRARIADVAEKLDSLRLHLSRCGKEGDEERTVLVDAIGQLRQAARGGRK